MNNQGRFLDKLVVNEVYPANEVYDYLGRGSQLYISTNFSSLSDLKRTGPQIDKIKVTNIISGWNRFEDGKHIIGHENSRIYFLEKQ